MKRKLYCIVIYRVEMNNLWKSRGEWENEEMIAFVVVDSHSDSLATHRIESTKLLQLLIYICFFCYLSTSISATAIKACFHSIMLFIFFLLLMLFAVVSCNLGGYNYWSCYIIYTIYSFFYSKSMFDVFIGGSN